MSQRQNSTPVSGYRPCMWLERRGICFPAILDRGAPQTEHPALGTFSKKFKVRCTTTSPTAANEDTRRICITNVCASEKPLGESYCADRDTEKKIPCVVQERRAFNLKPPPCVCADKCEERLAQHLRFQESRKFKFSTSGAVAQESAQDSSI